MSEAALFLAGGGVLGLVAGYFFGRATSLGEVIELRAVCARAADRSELLRAQRNGAYEDGRADERRELQRREYEP